MIYDDKNRVKHAVLTGNCQLYGGTYCLHIPASPQTLPVSDYQ